MKEYSTDLQPINVLNTTSVAHNERCVSSFDICRGRECVLICLTSIILF
jgi:hypothetical protein